MPSPIATPAIQETLAAVRTWRQANAGRIVGELIDFVRLPNNVYSPEQIQANAQALVTMLERRGARAECWPTASGRPAVFGERSVDAAAPTILFYCHFDGVPVEPERWHSAPYEPVLRTHLPAGAGADWSTIPLPAAGLFNPDWRLFARSVADSKNAILALLTALDALAAQGLRPGVNLKFLFDGEEEHESPGLPALLKANAHRLAADVLCNISGERHQSGRPTALLGERGILTLDITTYTTAVELHSGHFGNFAPNAAFRLAQLLASMKNPQGEITIAGFGADAQPLSERELAAIRAIPAIEPQLREQFGIAHAEVEGPLLQELINRPTLNVRGLHSGFVGDQARNIVPAQATADLDLRLVAGMDPDATLAAIVAHLAGQGYTVLDHAPSREELLAHDRVVRVVRRAGFPATRTPLDAPVAQRIVAALTRAVDDPPAVLPTDGGSLPMHLFTTSGPYVGLPTSNFDCNQHTDDENLRIGNLFAAVDIFASVLLG